MSKVKRFEKGELGYIDNMKQNQIKKGVIILACAIAIFVLGMALNKWETSNIFTIIAMVLIIPIANCITRYVLLFKFKTPDQAQYEKVKGFVKEGNVLLADNVITSEKKAMGFPYIVVTGDKILVMTVEEQLKASEAQSYLQNLVRKSGHEFKVTAEGFEDRYIGILKKSDAYGDLKFLSVEEKELFDAERDAVIALLRSQMV